MKRATPRWLIGILLTLLPITAPLAADENGDSPLTGGFRIGYRLVDVNGDETKYEEDIDLQQGARLFDLDLQFVPADGGTRKVLDRFELGASNLGGEAFEAFHLAAEKHGLYDLEYRRTESRYFYEDTIVPLELADPSLSNGGDFHTFDFDRVRDVASLGITLSPRASLDLGFDRFTKRGESTTTLDISRDEFELDRPIDEVYDDFHVGFQYSWPKVTLVLEESVRQYENAVEIFLPGFSLGENSTDSTTLDFFFLDQPYEYDSQQHTVRVNARPTDRLRIQASAAVQNLDLDVEGQEESQGVGFNGQPFTTDVQGAGEIERDLELFDIDLSYRLTDRVGITGGMRRYNLDQEGQFEFDVDGRGLWEVETTGFELGAQAHLTPEWTVSGGLRLESRDATFGHSTEGSAVDADEETTDRQGFFATASWRPTKMFRLEADIDDASYDDPFTLASPTGRQRYRLKARLRTDLGLYASATATAHRFENDDSGWTADRDQWTLRVGYRQDNLQFDGGFTRFESDRQIDQTVTTAAGFGGGVQFLVPVLYQSDADLFDLRGRWQAHERWTLGTHLRWWDNDGTFANQRQDLRCYAEVAVARGYSARLAYRTIEYEEAARFDDYDAEIVELSVGYRW